MGVFMKVRLWWRRSKTAPLHDAAKSGKLEDVKALILSAAKVDAKDEFVRTALHLASQQGHLDVVKQLVIARASVKVQDKWKDTPLHYACEKGYVDVVQFLIASGADVNAVNWVMDTPLHIASSKGHLDVVKHLVTSGAKIKPSNKEHRTPLHLASFEGHLEVVKHLIDSGASVDAKSKGMQTPLHLASKKGHLEIVKHLVSSGANVDAKDKYFKWTPLFLAACEGHLEIVKLLHASGATFDARDKNGKKPVDLAKQMRKENVVLFLVEAKRKQQTETCSPASLSAKERMSMTGGTSEDGSAIGARADAKDEGSQAPSQGASSRGQPVQGQPEQGQPVQGQPEQGQPVQGQAVQGHLDTVEHTDAKPRTLHNVVLQLMAAAANADAKDKDGPTPDVPSENGKGTVMEQHAPMDATAEAKDESSSHTLGGSAQLGKVAEGMEVDMLQVGNPRNPPAMEYDAFLTHCWGPDDQGRDNHQRVEDINKRLQAKGLTTWFDGQRMTGWIEKQMCEGINKSRTILVFLTRRYMEKLECEGDNCALEFGYAKLTKGLRCMVPIVMEESLLDPKAWPGGIAAMSLGPKLYVPMVRDEDIEASMGKLMDILAGLGVVPN